MSVEVEVAARSAIVRIANPPVNAIGRQVRQGLLDTVDSLTGAAIDRIVLTGAGSIFAAGADLAEFDGPAREPHLPDVIARMEAMAVPWIAAVEGAALGGGAELLLGCRYRITTPEAKIGFPEVTLGVIPGAGGTQRLPRLVGISRALELIASGRPITGEAALACGLVDAVSPTPLTTALALDLGAVASRRPLATTAPPAADPEAVEAASAAAGRRMRGQDAPLAAINRVAAAATEPFAVAIDAERRSFLELRASSQAKALRHVFFAERGARPPRNLRDVVPRDLANAVVVGGGTMGAAIAYALDSAGSTTTIVETDTAGADRARANVAALLAAAQRRGLLSADAAETRRQRITITVGYADVPPAELAIEAAFEDMAVKRQVFADLQAALPATAILATNTSYLDVDHIASAMRAPERVVGLHFFSPAHIMKLLEIVRGRATGDTALATAFAVAKRLAKVPVVAGVCDGFIGNRILGRYREAADMTLIDGATPWQIDRAMVAFGYAMGPYQAQDLSGLDIAYANRRRLAPARDPDRRYVTIADRLVEEGRLGRKTGAGWYAYADGRPEIDPRVEDIILREAAAAGITRRPFTADEIQTRMVAAMVNEAAAILADRTARTPSDIDLVTIHGYGFPRWRGGLLYHADAVGLAHIVADLDRFAADDPTVWSVTPSLRDLAARGASFASLNAA